MTSADQFAALKPGDVVMVRATVTAKDTGGSPAAYDAGDHVRVRVDGGTVFWSPAAEIVSIHQSSRMAA